MMPRADLLLTQRGLAASRTLAQRLIAAGRVFEGEGGRAVTKASDWLAEDAPLFVAPGEEDRYVSRGGLKLEGALEAARLDVAGKVCLDAGQSTGGFTDCLLARGAARVVGVEVGHSQLHLRLQGDPRVACIEGVNVRALTRDDLGNTCPAAGFDLVVGDLSFISLALVLPALAELTAADGHLLLLVKPQFEVGKAGLGKGGIVRDPALYGEVETKLRAAAKACGLTVKGWLDSPILGGDGNREFFLWAAPNRPE